MINKGPGLALQLGSAGHKTGRRSGAGGEQAVCDGLGVEVGKLLRLQLRDQELAKGAVEAVQQRVMCLVGLVRSRH